MTDAATGRNYADHEIDDSSRGCNAARLRSNTCRRFPARARRCRLVAGRRRGHRMPMRYDEAARRWRAELPVSRRATSNTCSKSAGDPIETLNTLALAAPPSCPHPTLSQRERERTRQSSNKGRGRHAPEFQKFNFFAFFLFSHTASPLWFFISNYIINCLFQQRFRLPYTYRILIPRLGIPGFSRGIMRCNPREVLIM